MGCDGLLRKRSRTRYSSSLLEASVGEPGLSGPLVVGCISTVARSSLCWAIHKLSRVYVILVVLMPPMGPRLGDSIYTSYAGWVIYFNLRYRRTLYHSSATSSLRLITTIPSSRRWSRFPNPFSPQPTFFFGEGWGDSISCGVITSSRRGLPLPLTSSALYAPSSLYLRLSL